LHEDLPDRLQCLGKAIGSLTVTANRPRCQPKRQSGSHADRDLYAEAWEAPRGGDCAGCGH